MAEAVTEPLDDNVDQLLPDQDFPPTEAEELDLLEDDPSLEADDLVVTEEEAPPIAKSWAFDFVTQAFKPGAGKGVLKTRGATTMRYWVEKALRTERGSYPIYDADYGMEGVDSLIGSAWSDRSAPELESRVRECLLFHPRITDVTNFTVAFEEQDEALYVSFRVVLDDDSVLPIRDLSLG